MPKLFKPSYGVFVIKAGVMLFSITAVMLYLNREEKWNALLLELQQLPFTNPLLWICIGLISLNWGLEAKRWQLLANKLEPTSFNDALSGVLTGLAFSIFSPSLLGDYAGKTLHLKSVRRLHSISAILLMNFSQFLITIIMGSFGFMYALSFYLVEFKQYNIGLHSFFLLFAIINVLLLLAYFNFPALANLFQKVFKKGRLKDGLLLLAAYTKQEVFLALLLSLARYVVFSLQFLLLFKVFEVDIPLAYCAAGISLIYLIKTIIPSLNLIGDLGLREFSALLLFQPFAQFQEKIVAASLILWSINLLLPTLIGIFFILRIKLKSSRLA